MTMSCPEVVYQAYYPYLYQRPSTSATSVARTTPFPPFSHQYDRFNVQRSLEHQQQAASSSGSSLPPSVDVYHPHHSSHHSSAGSVSSGGGGVGSPGSPPVSVLRHKEEDNNTAASSGEGGAAGVEDEDDDDSESGGTGGGSRAQYVSANCVVFTHYSGDVASVVDEHFSRALSYAENKGSSAANAQVKESSPMSARNFPPSFWNSNYQASSAATVTSHHSADLYGDPYHPHGAASASSDPWHSHYQQYSAAAAHHHHRAVHEYHHHHNMAAQYGGLLLPPTTRLPPHVTASHQYSKGAVPEPWGAASHSAAARLHHDQAAAAHHSHAHALDSAGYSAYPTMADPLSSWKL
ncbi:protein vestigial isoform X2 [Periplaneta americana]|uniref:protein vestigial isoform X2 n=1 Tax=Periplaneta americana TaxID=6978 RepID=UPI0037E99A66